MAMDKASGLGGMAFTAIFASRVDGMWVDVGRCGYIDLENWRILLLLHAHTLIYIIYIYNIIYIYAGGVNIH